MKIKENIKTILIVGLVLSNFALTWYIAVNMLSIIKENAIQIDGISKYLCGQINEAEGDEDEDN